jgi:hypothetical protein
MQSHPLRMLVIKVAAYGVGCFRLTVTNREAGQRRDAEACTVRLCWI